MTSRWSNNLRLLSLPLTGRSEDLEFLLEGQLRAMTKSDQQNS